MHSKPSLKIATSLMIMITLLGLVSASALALTQTAITPKDKSGALFSLLKNANLTTLEAFDRLKNTATAIPQKSLNEYKEAQDLAEEATKLHLEGNYSEASNNIIQALQKLKETLRIVYKAMNVQQTQTETTLERTVTLNSSISRFYEQLHHLQNLSQAAHLTGLNTSAIDTKIEAVELLLEKAQNNLNQERFQVAQDNIALAKTIMADLTIFLSNLAVELNTQRLQTYIAETQKRLNEIKAEASSTSNTVSLKAVSQAETSLNNAKTYLGQQLINATVTELVKSKDSENQAVAALTPTTQPSAVDATSPTSVLRP